MELHVLQPSNSYYKKVNLTAMANSDLQMLLILVLQDGCEVMHFNHFSVRVSIRISIFINFMQSCYTEAAHLRVCIC
jgi:hypothetical protein